MNSKLIFLLIILAAAVVFVVSIFPHSRENNLATPGSVNSSKVINGLVATPIPSSSPKEYKFDRSTDLKKELDNINPQVLDSDFK